MIKPKNLAIPMAQFEDLTIGKQYVIESVSTREFIIIDDNDDFQTFPLNIKGFKFEKPEQRLIQTTKLEVMSNFLVTYEVIKIEDGMKVFVRTIEQTDIQNFRKDVEHELENAIANPSDWVFRTIWE